MPLTSQIFFLLKYHLQSGCLNPSKRNICTFSKNIDLSSFVQFVVTAHLLCGETYAELQGYGRRGLYSHGVFFQREPGSQICWGKGWSPGDKGTLRKHRSNFSQDHEPTRFLFPFVYCFKVTRAEFFSLWFKSLQNEEKKKKKKKNVCLCEGMCSCSCVWMD